MPHFMPIEYDAVPTCDDGDWMLHVQQYDEERGKYVLVGPCGGITYEEEDFPTRAQQHAWWMRYWGHVLTWGNDPLNQLIPPTENVTKTERWQLSFTRSILGLILYARADGRGEWLSGEHIPEHLRQFMTATLLFQENTPTLAVLRDEDTRTLPRLKDADERHEKRLEWGKRPPTSRGAGHHAWCWLTLTRTLVVVPVGEEWYKAKGREAYNVEKINYEHAKEREE